MRAFLIGIAPLIFLCEPAHALRGVSPSAACTTVTEIEKDLDSSLQGEPDQIVSGELSLSFLGHSNGREALIHYKCKFGKVTAQLITTPVDSESEGRLVFSESYADLSAEFGEPFKDLDEPSVAALKEDGANLTRRYVIWANEDRLVSLTLWRSDSQWEVVVLGP